MTLLWDNMYNVGISKIDDQHKKLFQILNELLTSIEERKSDQGLNKVFDELIDYSNYHFKTEEDYFKEYDYYDTASHIKDHNAFREKIKAMSTKYQNHEDVLSDLVDLLEDWLIEHINVTDKLYSKFLIERGVNKKD